MTQYRKWSTEAKRIVHNAYDELVALKKKPFIMGNKCMTIRFHHRKRYFNYNPVTGKWCNNRYSSSRSWWHCSSTEHLMERINEYCDYCDKLKEKDNDTVTEAVD